MMLKFCAVATAMALLGSQAMADGVTPPLAPGKPAGVKEAQTRGDWVFYAAAGGLAIAGFALFVSDSGNKAVTAAATTTTSTSTTKAATTST